MLFTVSFPSFERYKLQRPEIVLVFVAQVANGKAVVVVVGVPYSHVLGVVPRLYLFVTVVSSLEVTTWPSTVAAVI